MQNHLRLLTPGPTAIPDRVRLAMAMPMIHHRKPEFKSIMEETRVYLKKLFGTEQEVLPLASSGTGAMTAAVTNLFARGEKVLVAQAGKFGERWGGCRHSRRWPCDSCGLPHWESASDPGQCR